MTMRSAATDSKTTYNYAHTTKQALQNTIKEPGTNHTPKRTDRTRRAQEVPFIAGRSDFIRKNTRFRSGFLPSTSPMQHSYSHYNAFCSNKYKCDLQPQIPKDPRTTHTRRNKHCKTPSMNQPHTKTNGPHPPRTRGTFHRRLKPLHTEKHKVSCSGFLPSTSSMQHPRSHYNSFCNN